MLVSEKMSNFARSIIWRIRLYIESQMASIEDGGVLLGYFERVCPKRVCPKRV